jgi:hypothetical protein
MLPVVLKGAEVIRRRHNAKVERRLNESERARITRRVIAGFGACALVGAAMSMTDTPHSVIEQSANGGTGTVFEINRTLSVHHVVGFKTEIDGATGEQKETNRTLFETVPGLNLVPLVKEIPAPDIIANVKIDDLIITSDFCFPGGEKKMKEYEVNGIKNIDYTVDPADIRVCSAEDPMYEPTVTPGGNFITNMNNADTELQKIPDGSGKDVESVKKANATKETIRKLAVNAALLTVNRVCAPQVLEVTKDDIKTLLADDIRRDGEVVNVIFEEGAGHVFEGESVIDAFFNQKKEEEKKDDKFRWNYGGGDVTGTCTLAAEFDKAHEKDKKNAK